MKKGKFMKQILISLALVIAVMGFSAHADKPTARGTVGGTFVTQFVATLKANARWDSSIASTTAKTLMSNYPMPRPGWEYVIVRDTLTNKGGAASRDSAFVSVQFVGKHSDGRVMYALDFDTIYQEGSKGDMYAIPTGSRFQCSQFDVKLVPVAADSIVYNRFWLYQRKLIAPKIEQ
jgi:hypothetical protein